MQAHKEQRFQFENTLCYLARTKHNLARLVDYFFFRLWKYSQGSTGYQLAKIEPSDHSNQTIVSKLADFTLKYPESGNLPQYLVSQLISGLFRVSKVEVVGGDESVFGTNTTSKKPADIWFEVEGIPTNLYEVTDKPVSKKYLMIASMLCDQLGT